MNDSPDPTSTPGPVRPRTFRFQEGDEPDADYAFMVEVVDLSGKALSARQADFDKRELEIPVPIPDGPLSMGLVELPTDANSLLVAWRGDKCETRSGLWISRSAEVISLREAPRVGCSSGRTIVHRVVIRFASGVDVDEIAPSAGDPLVGPADVRPNSLALGDGGHVWVGGWSPADEGVVLVSTNMGNSWSVAGTGWGHVIDLDSYGGRDAIAVVQCEGCPAGTLYGTGPLFTRIPDYEALRVSMRNRADGIRIIGPYAGSEECCYWLRSISLEGGTPSLILNPCPDGDRPADVVKLGAEWVEMICVSEGSNQAKRLMSSKDNGQTWEVLASSALGELPGAGAVKGFDMSAGGFGLLWGAGAAPSVTIDGGTTWRSLSVADGSVRVARGGDVFDDGTGALLVWDERRSKTLVLLTRNAGASWSEMTSLEGG